jgi:hypothetical protein
MAMCRGALPIIAAVTAALAAGAFSTAQAQQQQPSPQLQAQQPAVSDKEIQNFADAATEIRQLNQKWTPKVQAAAQQGPEAEQKARQQAVGEMTQALQKNGLSVERYNKIVELAQADPEVQHKIQQRMQTKQ